MSYRDPAHSENERLRAEIAALRATKPRRVDTEAERFCVVAAGGAGIVFGLFFWAIESDNIAHGMAHGWTIPLPLLPVLGAAVGVIGVRFVQWALRITP